MRPSSSHSMGDPNRSDPDPVDVAHGPVPRVSVVMSVYNGERYLQQTIDGILGQHYLDFEFIIIDDGSTDGTATILVRRADGLCWAVLFNARSNAKGTYLSGLIDPLVHEAANRVKRGAERQLE